MSIADKLTYLQTTKQLLKTEINKINNVLTDNSTFRSYPQELFNGYLDILNNGTDTLWNNLEKVSQSGTEAVLEGVETAPMKVELQGNTQQNGEPTPDTPIPVQVVTGENVVSVQGKNLFDKDNDVTLKMQATFTGTEDNEFTPSTSNIRTLIITKVPSNSEITISINNDNYIQSRYFISQLKTPTIEAGKNEKWYTGNSTIVTTDKTNYLGIVLEIKNNGTTVYSTQEAIDEMKLQIEEGSTVTPYVPYSKTDYPINLGDIELCKINTYKDYFHKDNGKWYVHKEIGKKIFDGSETWRKDTGYFNCNASLGGIAGQGYTNYYKYGSLDTLNNFVITTNAFRVNADFETLEDYKNWLSTHNVILYYVLATPTETEITNTTLIEQLEAISKAKSVKDKTYITQTNDGLPFILDVEAIKEYEVN